MVVFCTPYAISVLPRGFGILLLLRCQLSGPLRCLVTSFSFPAGAHRLAYEAPGTVLVQCLLPWSVCVVGFQVPYATVLYHWGEVFSIDFVCMAGVPPVSFTDLTICLRNRY